MNRLKLTKKIIVPLLAAGMALSVFAGCQNKVVSSDSNQSSVKAAGQSSDAASSANSNSGNSSQSGNTNQSSNGSQKSRGRINQETLKEDINAFVTDKTITQAQADKILETLTTYTQGARGQGTPPSNGQDNNNQNSSTQPPAKSDNTQSPAKSGNGDRQKRNPLSQLVTDGVITQEQADKVLQKVMPSSSSQNSSAPQNNQTTQSTGA